MTITQCFRESRSGVAQIRLVNGNDLVGGGTGFLVDRGLVTNSHVIRAFPNATLSITFLGEDGELASDSIRVSVEDVVELESPEVDSDFAYLKMDEPEFSGRHHFALADEPRVAVRDSSWLVSW